MKIADNVPRLVSLVFGLVALVLLAGAAIAFVVGPRLARAELERLQRIRRVTAISLDDTPPGVEAALDGTISDRNPIVGAGFVAFDCIEETTASDGTTETSLKSSQHPPLAIDTTDGVVSIMGQYQIQYPYRTARGSGCTYQGWRPGDAVAVIGTTAAGAELTTIDARLIAGETLDAMLARQQRAAGGPSVLGIMLAALGTLFTTLAIALGWAFRSSKAI